MYCMAPLTHIKFNLMCAYDEVDSEIENIVHICIKFKNLIYGLGVNHLSGINLNKAMKAMDVQHSTEMIILLNDH